MSGFKVAAAQIASVRGDVDRNVAAHASAIEQAARQGVAVVVFPELSLIGYEPDLASVSAIAPSDDRTAPLRALAERHRIDVVIGASLRNDRGKPRLGAILFTADGDAKTYAKMHLGGEEPMYFDPGDAPMPLSSRGETIGLAICADASRPSHVESYLNLGATIYAAGVFLNAEWFATDAPRLAGISERHRITVLMANHADSVGTRVSVGKSAAWGPDGALLARANGTERCLVIASRERAAWRGEVVEVKHA